MFPSRPTFLMIAAGWDESRGEMTTGPARMRGLLEGLQGSHSPPQEVSEMNSIPILPVSSERRDSLRNQESPKASSQQNAREGACPGGRRPAQAMSTSKQAAPANSPAQRQHPGRDTCGFFGGRQPFEPPTQDRAETLVGGSENAAANQGPNASVRGRWLVTLFGLM